MTVVIGLDLSLTATGYARIDGPTATVGTIRSTGHKGDTLAQRVQRIRRLAADILAHIDDPDLVVIEAPAFSSTTGSVWDRAGLWHQVVDHLDIHGHPYVEIAPTRVKKFATGKGNADKTAVAAGMTRMWPNVEPGNDNEFDALALASLGTIHLGGDTFDVLARHREVVDAIDWPEVAA